MLCLLCPLTAIECERLPVPENGVISVEPDAFGAVPYNSIFEFRCNSGYELVSEETMSRRTCQSNRLWTGQDAVCRGTMSTCIFYWLILLLNLPFISAGITYHIQAVALAGWTRTLL